MPEPQVSDLPWRGRSGSGTFRHADHVWAGFELLRTNDFPTALYKFSVGLKAIADHAGKPGAYHATMTLAFLSLIAEQSAAGCFGTADDFVRSDPEVMDKAILRRWYSPERLHSETARRIFLLPEAVR